jgi:hypothetical protein
MRTFRHLLVAVPLLVAFAIPAANAAVEVDFVNPDKFVDAAVHRGPSKERERTFTALRQHIEKLGDRYLKPGQVLKVEVLDLDRAGRVEWWQPQLHDARIMRDVDSPSMKVRYTLAENGTVITSGEERIGSPGYLWGPRASTLSTDSLKYEKTMLQDWFHNRFGKSI